MKYPGHPSKEQNTGYLIYKDRYATYSTTATTSFGSPIVAKNIVLKSLKYPYKIYCTSFNKKKELSLQLGSGFGCQKSTIQDTSRFDTLLLSNYS